ncbi:unnamed protein product [Oreochromis niloticus]|nr:unnamed protein product [Mustela putorius furo]
MILRKSALCLQIEPAYKNTFPSSFVSLAVVSFRQGSVINTIALQFVNSSVPNDTEIKSVLISQASNVTGFDIERASITVSDTFTPTTNTSTTSTTTATPTITTSAATTTTSTPTTTTAAPTTTTTTKAPTAPVQVFLFLQFLEPYVPDLTDPTSSVYQDRKRRVEDTCNRIYKPIFPIFIRAIVIRFSLVRVQTRVDGTEAVVELVFNQTAPNAQVPNNTTVVQTLKEAINSSSSNFSITIVPDTISVTSVPVNATTAAPTTANSTTAAPTASTTTIAVSTTTASSGECHKINPSTVFPLVLLLWLLSNQQ